MTRTMSISDTGLRLIKAFEGFRPTDRELVTGARVVGYGHRLYSDMPMRMSRPEAEERLKLDLESYEELVNDEVHAPLSQPQFDALVSLAFNIGPKAFRASDVVRSMNNGRVLDAANGFDVWRKANIAGETYVVDALLRRRTAEKALFLRSGPYVPASSAMLKPEPDDKVPGTNAPTYSRGESEGLVAKAVYDKEPVEENETVDPEPETTSGSDDDVVVIDAPSLDTAGPEIETLPSRRRDDDPVGVLTLSETLEPEGGDGETLSTVDSLQDDLDVIVENSDDIDRPVTATTDLESDSGDTEALSTDAPSPITEAADALGERLNKLLDQGDEEAADRSDSPVVDLDIETETYETRSNLLAFPGKRRVQTDGQDGSDDERYEATLSGADGRDTASGETIVIDNLAADDALRTEADTNAVIVDPDGDPAENAALYLSRNPPKRDTLSLWIPLIVGATLLGMSFALLARGATALLNGWGPLAVVAAAITGGLMVLFALYAAARGRFS